MSDAVDTGNGTPERVALDLMIYVCRHDANKNYDTKDAILDLYEECRRSARSGSRNK